MKLPQVPMPERVKQVAILLLEGLSEKEVATTLGLSPFTVHDYVKKLYRILGVRSRPEFFAYMIAQDFKGSVSADPHPGLAELRKELAEVRQAMRDVARLLERAGRLLGR